MEDKNKFLQIIEDMKDYAVINQRSITLEEIKEFLDENDWNEQQLDMICAYLISNEIKVEGVQTSGKNIALFQKEQAEEEQIEPDRSEESEKHKEENKKSWYKTEEKEDESMVTLYEEELEEKPTLTKDEIQSLVFAVQQQDAIAKSQLLEGVLKVVVEIAKEFMNRGMDLGDIIQEGNIGLLLAIDAIENGSVMDVSGEDYFRQAICQNIKEAIADSNEERRISDEVLIKANVIHEGAKNLAEEYQRQVTVEELADYLQMDESEIKDMMPIAKDTLPINEEGAME